MERFLAGLAGKTIDVFCGGASSLRGEVQKVEDGVLYLKDDDSRMCFIAIEKIMVVWEKRDDEHSAGFVSFTSKK
ncbi:MAG TPA: MM0924 family protein [Pyrinomonadaceae bacterium]|nr:MM0924 family protein [Pyrinomonadaceae bacterium]